MNNIIFMNLFILIALILGSLDIIGVKMKKINIIISIIFIFIVATREKSIPDTVSYITLFTDLSSYYEYYRMEKGFVLFTEFISKYITNNYVFYFAIISFINMIIINKILKKITLFSFFPILLYISFYGIYFNMVIIRFGIAFSLYLFSLINFNKNKKLAIVFFILALFFHKSIFLGILSFFISKKKQNKKLYISILFIIAIIYYLKISYLYIEFFINKLLQLNIPYKWYLKNILYGDRGISYRFSFNYLLAILFCLKDIKNKYYYKFLNIYLMGLLFLSAFSSLLLIERLVDIFIVSNFILLSIYISENRDRIKSIFLFQISYILNYIFIYRIMFK